MILERILTPTRVATPGMTVREVFEECARANIPGLPCCTRTGRIMGRVTLKNILKSACLPDYIIESARILGDELSCTGDIESRAAEVLCDPVDPYIQGPHISLPSGANAIKALAMMEQSDTSYLFVVDRGQYRGAVTIQSLARTFIQLARQCGD